MDTQNPLEPVVAQADNPQETLSVNQPQNPQLIPIENEQRAALYDGMTIIPTPENKTVRVEDIIQDTETSVPSNKPVATVQTEAISGEVVEVKPKHPGGRPTKYNDEMLQQAKDYFNECMYGIKDPKDTDGRRYIKAPRTPLIEELELMLDIDDDTIVEWAKDEDKQEFSATYKKLKKLNKLRLKQILIRGKTNPLGPKFLLEVDHGMISAEKRILAGERNGEALQVTIKDYTPAASVAETIVDNVTS